MLQMHKQKWSNFYVQQFKYWKDKRKKKDNSYQVQKEYQRLSQAYELLWILQMMDADTISRTSNQ